jgi:hypothetical protein
VSDVKTQQADMPPIPSFRRVGRLLLETAPTNAGRSQLLDLHVLVGTALVEAFLPVRGRVRTNADLT